VIDISISAWSRSHRPVEHIRRGDDPEAVGDSASAPAKDLQSRAAELARLNNPELARRCDGLSGLQLSFPLLDWPMRLWWGLRPVAVALARDELPR